MDSLPMIGIRHVFIVVLALFVSPGCDTQGQQDDFAEEASRPPSNYSHTDEGGTELSPDNDDWRTSPTYAGKVSVRPAYPNPVDAGEFVTVPITVTAFGSVRAPLHVETMRDDRLFRLDQIDQATDPGSYVFTFSAASFGRKGLNRVYIFDGVGEIVSYGDIMVQ